LLACGGEETSLETGDGKVRIQRDGEAVQLTVETDEGETVMGSFGEGTALPADLPGDVPVYPGAQVLASISAGGRGTMLTLRADAAAGDVHSFYRSKLVEKGWTIEGEMNLGGQQTLMAEKADRKATVQIGSSDDGTQIVVSVTGGE
jgi:hypothetical protein